MTVITVHTPAGRLSLDQRRTLARTLTDAVLVPEVGRFEPPRGTDICALRSPVRDGRTGHVIRPVGPGDPPEVRVRRR